jgi:hypothetical protein
MSETPHAPAHSRHGNPGVPVGCILLVACFFLPWVPVIGLSAVRIASDPEAAEAAFGALGLGHPSPIHVTRLLFFVPLLALSTWMLDASVPPGASGRLAAKIGVLMSGVVLAFFFAAMGFFFGPHLGAGFWGSLMGSLFILVGVIFNVARNE